MSHWFIDGGAHRGESIQFAREYFEPSPSFIAIEPEPACWEDIAAAGAVLIPAALWTSTGTASFYQAAHEVSSTLIPSKTTGGVSRDRSIIVPTVTLQSILRALPDDAEITVKLDIEGAEYDILEQAIADKSLRFVRHLFVDFHATRIQDFPAERHNKLVERLLSSGFTLPKWSPSDRTILDWRERWLIP